MNGVPQTEILQRQIQQYTDNLFSGLDEAIQNALDKRIDPNGNVVYDLTTLNKQADTKKLDGDIDMNNFAFKNTRPAVTSGDVSTLGQTVHEETKNIEWTEGLLSKSSKYIDESRLFFVSNPKAPIGGQFVIENVQGVISQDKQVANLGWVKDNALLKNQDVDLQSQYRVVNLLAPSSNLHAVNKKYCDENSGKNEQNPGFTNLINNLLGNVVSGVISGLIVEGIKQAFGGYISQGITAIGSFATSLVSGASSLVSGLRIGSSQDWANAKASDALSNGEKQLIDNLQDDIANGGQQGGQIFTGANVFDGLVRLTKNAQRGLFELV